MMNRIRYISLFSGIECASVAARPLGWKPVCFSEVEPFPCAVLAYHYPDVPNAGDVTAFDWKRYKSRCDLVIGGSPCQAFSVAGRRESLADKRGNLTLAFVEAVNDISPEVVVWENVPGVLSVRDNAFGCFLAALAGHDAPIVVPGGKRWPNAGVVAGPRRVLAWRVLDAQYFGVPQRRRRVFLVGCSRASGIDSSKILFESGGLPGHPAPGGKAGKKAAARSGCHVAGGGGDVTGCLNAGHSDKCDPTAETYIVGALGNNGKAAGSATGQDAEQGLLIPAVAGTFGGGSGNRGWCNDLDTSGAFIPVVAGTLTGSRSDAGPDENDAARGMYVTHTLRGEGYDASEDGTGRRTPPMAFTCKNYGGDAGELSPTLRALTHDKSHANGGGQVAVAFHGSQDPDVSGGVTHPVGRNQGQETCVAFTQNQDGDVAPALGTNANATGRNTAKVVHGGVRRLTPIECERLQGLPDDYTRIPWRGKPACECPDGPRYKAIGNGMTVPCIEWIFRRIDAAWRKDGKVHEGDG